MEYTPKHRGEPKVVWRLTYMESERGWGQSYWTFDFDTEEEAIAAKRECNAKNNLPHAPDYYIQAQGIERVVL